MADYRTILVTTDLSDPSLAALRHAAELGRRLGSRIVATYVFDDRLPAVILAQTGQSAETILARHRQHAEKALNETVRKHLPDAEVEVIVRQGTAHTEIVKLAAERHVDLIVIGMHGHGFLKHALAGSTAERVLHHAPCPVLVVAHDS